MDSLSAAGWVVALLSLGIAVSAGTSLTPSPARCTRRRACAARVVRRRRRRSRSSPSRCWPGSIGSPEGLSTRRPSASPPCSRSAEFPSRWASRSCASGCTRSMPCCGAASSYATVTALLLGAYVGLLLAIGPLPGSGQGLALSFGHGHPRGAALRPAAPPSAAGRQPAAVRRRRGSARGGPRARRAASLRASRPLRCCRPWSRP